MIAALGVVTIIAGVVLVSSTNAAQGLKGQSIQQRQTKALAALEAVLTRREAMISILAINGNSAWPALTDWTGVTPPNFGVDVVGDCLVRWRIEPTRTVKGDDLVGVTSTGLKYIVNPPPDGVSANSDPNSIQNPFSFLYRVAAEAEYPGRNLSESSSLAQGARYVAVSAQPTFRWAINYTRNGPLGDLELSHNPAVMITGNVNSNGAIYIGSNLMVNDLTSLSGGIGDTRIGPNPSGTSVVVSGYDGIYRLSKANAYGFMNKFPMVNGSTASDPALLMTSVNTSLFGDLPNISDKNSWDGLTMKGRFINPFRIKDSARLETVGNIARTINNIPLIGDSSGTAANDSRDGERTSDSAKFKAIAASQFGNYIRTAQTTARREVLSKEFQNRALEPQMLVYREVDGDVLTDDHDFALPQFYSPQAGGSVTTTWDPVAAASAVNTVSGADKASGTPNDLLVEVPGPYVAKVLGSNQRAMTRKADGTGWDITDRKGVPLGAVSGAGGVMIRERPVPKTDFWPGSTGADKYMQFSDPQALPYALGKHWRPVSMPFTPIDITDNLYSYDTRKSWANIGPFDQATPSTGWDRSATYPNRAVQYKYSGTLFMIGANGVTITPPDSSTWITSNTATLTPSPQANFSYVPGNQYHNATWRMVHLKNRYGLTDDRIMNLAKGLRYSYWNDDARVSANGTTDNYNRPDQFNNMSTEDSQSTTRQPLLGPPVATGVSPTIGAKNEGRPWRPLETVPATVKGDSENNYSVRWEGFLIPPVTGAYTFQVYWDDSIRIWIDDRLIFENMTWNNRQWFSTQPVTMQNGHPSKIVIDFAQGTGGHGMALQWSVPGVALGFSDIPQDNMRAAPESGGFDRAKFTSMVARIKTDSFSSLARNPKVGLMIRPNGGEPDMVNGRDAYLALCWSPARGVFLERRQVPARIFNRASTSIKQWIGAGDCSKNGASSISADADGLISAPYGYNASYTPRGSSTPDLYVVNRTATMTCAAPSAQSATSVINQLNQKWDDGGAVNPTTIAGVNFGDGSATDIKYGPYTKIYTQSAYITKTASASRNYKFKISGGSYPAASVGLSLPIGSVSRDITLYDSQSSSNSTTAYSTLRTYEVSDATTILLSQSQSVMSPAGVAVYGQPITKGDSRGNNIWIPNAGWPSGYDGNSFVTRLNNIRWNGRNDWILGNGTGILTGPSNSDLITLSPTPPDDPSISLPDLFDRKPHSFSMNASRVYALYMDTNSFTSRLGAWSPTPVPENRPWSTSWDVYGIVPALTNSFRPDLANLPVLGAGPAQLRESSSANAAAAPTPATLLPTPSPVPWADDVAVTPVDKSIWLRISRNSATNDVTFEYNTGATSKANGQADPSGEWRSVATTEAVSINDMEWASLLAGPAIQSGEVQNPVQVSIDNLSVATTEDIGNNDNVWNWKDWDNASIIAGKGSPLSRYYASQYQVFFGANDITEDFFTWGDQTGNDPIATEDWFYNPREFWSQSDTFQYWDSASAFSNLEPWGASAVERPKDKLNFKSRWNPATGWINAYTASTKPYVTTSTPSANSWLLKDNGTDLTNRANWSKTTVIILNLKSLWVYLQGRDVNQAKTTGILDGSTSALPNFLGDPLSKSFNGLIYVARTNRYPFNPNQPLTDPSIDPRFDASSSGSQSDPSRIGGVNPWSFSVRTSSATPNLWEYPNGITPNNSSPKTASPNYTGLTVSGSTPTWAPSTVGSNELSMTKSGISKLQPYDQIKVFPIRPQQFIQGVMIKNGENINWGTGGSPAFGSGGTTIVTPNCLYVHGDLNTQTNTVKVSGVDKVKITPLAIMADSITFLSKSFSIANFQRAGLVIDSSGPISGGGILANPSSAVASSTTFNAGIITHNQPTTQARVLEGQGASFIDTMQFLENWSGTTMTYTGSLVVMDTRRYTDAFLLGGPRSAGRSPMGYLGWPAMIDSARGGPGLSQASSWLGQVPQVYTAPTRILNYQLDFLTGPGTPPFVPNGMSTVGVGGWSRALQ